MCGGEKTLMSLEIHSKSGPSPVLDTQVLSPADPTVKWNKTPDNWIYSAFLTHLRALLHRCLQDGRLGGRSGHGDGCVRVLPLRDKRKRCCSATALTRVSHAGRGRTHHLHGGEWVELWELLWDSAGGLCDWVILKKQCKHKNEGNVLIFCPCKKKKTYDTLSKYCIFLKNYK